MSTQPSPHDDARGSINRILEINQRHGMGGPVSDAKYERVIKETESAFSRLVEKLRNLHK